MAGTLMLWVLLGGSASAQSTNTDTKAKEWFINGQHLYQEGRYRDALVAFEAAFRMSSRPNVLKSIAYCYENLGETGNAIDVLYRYRGLAEEVKIPEIDRHIRRLEARLEEDRAVAPPPPPVVKEPVKESKPAYRPAPRQIAPRSGHVWGTGPVVLYSVAGAAAINGAVFAIQANGARQSAAELCSQDDAVYCPRTAAQHINNDWLYSVVADVSFGVAGTVAVGATLWMIMHNRRQTAALTVVPLGNGLGLAGRF